MSARAEGAARASLETEVRMLHPTVLAHLLLRQQHAPMGLCAPAAPLLLAALQAVVRVLLPAVLAHQRHRALPTAF